MAVSPRSQPTTMWFDQRLILHDSPIHGVGTFALDDISMGEQLIAVTGGLVFAQADLEAGRFQISGRLYNQAHLTEELRHVTPVSFHYYVNHSCEPNVVDLSRYPTNTQYVALRDIRAGEEIAADYYTKESLAECLCGSPNCRWRGEALPSPKAL